MGNRQAHRGKVLIVESNALVRELLIRLLSDNYDVETASSGQEGVSMLVPGYYDVVLIDLETSEAGGGQVAKAMKRIDLPLITALITESELQETDPRLNDIDFQIQKPFQDPADVREMIALAMQTREARAIALYS